MGQSKRLGAIQRGAACVVMCLLSGDGACRDSLCGLTADSDLFVLHRAGLSTECTGALCKVGS